MLIIPADVEVAEVRASVRGADYEKWLVPEFAVPEEHIPVILGWLRPVEHIVEPWRLDWLSQWGEVTIVTRSGSNLRLRFYDAGSNPAVITENGVDQFWAADYSGDGRFYGSRGMFLAVRAAYRASKK